MFQTLRGSMVHNKKGAIHTEWVFVELFLFSTYPPANEASQEVANLNEIKYTYPL
jgi:hypothetical protein